MEHVTASNNQKRNFSETLIFRKLIESEIIVETTWCTALGFDEVCLKKCKHVVHTHTHKIYIWRYMLYVKFPNDFL
jgi:hypothetical protein